MLYKDKFEEIFHRWENKQLNCIEASELLHCSVRTFHRKRANYEENGLEGVLDRRIGNSPPNKISSDRISQILSLRKESPDYNLQHLHEELSKNQEINESYSSFRRIVMMGGMYKIGRKPRKKYRKRRKPRPQTGMMIHQDGSTHNWLPNTKQKHDLIITMDDANNEIYSAFLCNEEGTFSSFRGIQDVINKKGLFTSFYVDRGSHYGHTSKAGERVDLSKPTQVARALKRLDIHIIYSRCPQGRGRSERMFKTWQGRLPQELAKNNIQSMEQANIYIKEIFLPKMNKRFIRKASNAESGFITYVGRPIEEMLCIQEERVVNHDNTVSYKNKILQIAESKYEDHYVKSRVMVHEYEDGTLEVYYGPRRLARFIGEAKHYIHPETKSNNRKSINIEENDETLDKKKMVA